MVLLELGDFDFWVDNAVVVNVYAFSSIFVFIIDWAYKNCVLDKDFVCSEPFHSSYPKLLSGKMNFEEFVDKVLDGKLTEEIFKNDIKEFISDYIVFDGLSKDMSGFFELPMWEFPTDFERSGKLNEVISKSRENYKKHKLNFPELVIFDDEYNR